jgi:hypothetical protein
VYVIKNKVNGQFASRNWMTGSRDEAWCELDAAQPYVDPEYAQRQIDDHAVPGTCQVVEFPGMVHLAGE